MDHEHVAVGAMEPGEDEHFVAGLDALQPIEDVGVELDPGVRRALVALLRGGFRIGQRRGDAADFPELEGQGYGRVIQSISGCA
jgi:hypothetical protein